MAANICLFCIHFPGDGAYDFVLCPVADKRKYGHESGCVKWRDRGVSL